MSLSINHPIGKVTSTTSLSFEVQGGTPTAPKSINLSASSVIMPNVQQPVGQKGAMIFNSTDSRMKYFDGNEWISWVPASEISNPINQQIANINNILKTKVDSVVYNSSAVPSASVSDNTLYITFPTGNPVTGGNGLFTSSPPGSISYYSLISGQTPASIREQMGGSVNSQAGRNGTQAAPYITSTGWCYADGNYWLWRGSNGDVVQKVPNLNQNAYIKGMSTSGITKTDSVIASSGTASATSLNISQLPPINFTVTGTTSVAGSHSHTQQLRGNDRSGLNAITPSADANGTATVQNINTSGDHTHTFTGTTNTIGSGQGHTHTLSSLDTDHFNAAVLYNIAQPSLALNQSAGDARYVLKSGDVMTGTLTIASSAVIRGNDTNLTMWFTDSSNNERGVIYHNFSTNSIRFRANGGNEVSINNSGVISSSGLSVTGNGVLSGSLNTGSMAVAGALSSSSLNVTGSTAIVGGRNIVRSVNGAVADASGNVTFTSGVQDVRLSARVNSGRLPDAAWSYAPNGAVLTGIFLSYDGSTGTHVDNFAYNYIQKNIDGVWYTISVG